MTEYTAPVRDTRFVLRELVDLDALAKLEGFGEAAAPDVVDQVLEEAGRFANGVLSPLNPVGDKQGARLENGVVYMPEGFPEAYRQFCEMGWSSVPFSPEWGGQGMPWTVNMALNEMWQSANMSLADGMMLTQGAVDCLETHGTDDQKATYLPKLISGEWSGTMNLTEPQAGSDLGMLKTRATPEGDHYRIKGTKIFITHGDQNMTENVVHLVLARLPDAPEGVRGISLFVVPKFLPKADGSVGERNDLRVVSLEHKLGHRASPTAVMSYGDDEGAIGWLVGQENQGLRCMFTMMNNARLNVGVQGIAIAERAYQQALDYARERVQGQLPGRKDAGRVTIIEHPDVRRMLLDMRAQIEAMRGLALVTAEALDLSHHHPDPAVRAERHQFVELMTPVVKGWSTDLGFEIASTALQVHGGMGYIEETGIAQHLRDARITMIYEGTNGIQAWDLVGRKLVQAEGASLKAFLETMNATAAELAEQPGAAMQAIRTHLVHAAGTLREAAEWLAGALGEDPLRAAAGATPFLRMMGVGAGAWIMARSALKAAEALKRGEADSAFLEQKIATARYFAEALVPPAMALIAPVKANAETVLPMTAEAF
ncbi:MAG: acyl-CoA dehydrogenase [Rhodospirillaceae bacterium]|nr:acyl-CoA dehydrogenase [Rhodospirillaceae bacterium]